MKLKKVSIKKTIKKPGNWYYLNCDVYDVKIALYVGDQMLSLKNGNRFLKKHFPKNYKNIINDIQKYINGSDNNTNNWCMDCTTNSKQCITIFLDKCDITDASDLSVMCHEFLHAALYITDFREITQFKTANEALVYLFEWIFRNFYKQLKKVKTK